MLMPRARASVVRSSGVGEVGGQHGLEERLDPEQGPPRQRRHRGQGQDHARAASGEDEGADGGEEGEDGERPQERVAAAVGGGAEVGPADDGRGEGR